MKWLATLGSIIFETRVFSIEDIIKDICNLFQGINSSVFILMLPCNQMVNLIAWQHFLITLSSTL